MAVLSAAFSVAVPLSLFTALTKASPLREFFAGIFLGMTFGPLFVTLFSFAQALCLIVVTEIFRLRNWLFYAIAGGATGISALMLPLGRQMPDPGELAVFFYGGAIAGLVYWSIAGRNAGAWTSQWRATPTSECSSPEKT